jgi:UDP-glucose 4-epimerase
LPFNPTIFALKILVTGGAGFIGSNIVDALLAKGHQVHALDNLYTGDLENLNPQARFHQLDIRDEKAASLIEQERFDAIFHQAAQLDVRKSVSDPQFDASVNILGSLNLISAAQRSGCQHFIFASSGGVVYGEQVEFPANEEHPCNPISPYGVSKLAVEKYLYYYGLEFGMKYSAMRYANIYGPRQNPHGEAGVVAIFTNRALQGGGVVINGDGLQTRDYVHVDDVVAANLLVLEQGLSGAFNVGLGEEHTVVDIFHATNKFVGNRMEQVHGPAKPGEQRRSVLDSSKLRALGWSPKWGFDTGMHNTLEWFAKKYKTV